MTMANENQQASTQASTTEVKEQAKESARTAQTKAKEAKNQATTQASETIDQAQKSGLHLVENLQDQISRYSKPTSEALVDIREGLRLAAEGLRVSLRSARGRFNPATRAVEKGEAPKQDSTPNEDNQNDSSASSAS